MALHRAFQLTRLDIPNLDVVVESTRRQPAAIRTPAERRNPLVMAFKQVQ